MKAIGSTRTEFLDCCWWWIPTKCRCSHPQESTHPDSQLSSRNFLPGSISFLEKQDRETTNTFKPSNVRVSQNNLAYSIQLSSWRFTCFRLATTHLPCAAIHIALSSLAFLFVRIYFLRKQCNCYLTWVSPEHLCQIQSCVRIAWQLQCKHYSSAVQIMCRLVV